MAIISVENVGKTYNDEGVATIALSDITFSLDEGEYIAIMGQSGSGKSTLLHILGFLDRHTSGTYLFDGVGMDEMSDEELATTRNKKMGFVFQAYNLLARTSVLDNVKLPLLYSDIPQNKWDEKAKIAIDSVGLAHRINHESGQLSGGEKQRVAIARALINDPAVVFADEPTGNLDSKSGGQIMEIIENLNNDGKTVILITHETYLANSAKRKLTLLDGKLVSDEIIKSRVKANGKLIK